jgi:hypothetical protein
MAARRSALLAISPERYQGVIRILEIASSALIVLMGSILLLRTVILG